jgi:hypothetical protein
LVVHRRYGRDRVDPELLTLGRKWAAIMDTLPKTSERHSIAGSFAKRMAVLEPAQWHEHVQRAIGRYVESARVAKARAAPDDRNLYGFLNALQLAALVDDGAGAVGELVTIGWVRRWIKDLTAIPPRNGSFWAFVAPADSALTAALVPPGSALGDAIGAVADKLDDRVGAEALRSAIANRLDGDDRAAAASIAADYLRPRARARIRQWNSVVENVELLRDIAAADGRSCAAGLGDLAERLRQDDR